MMVKDIIWRLYFHICGEECEKSNETQNWIDCFGRCSPIICFLPGSV